ncbi:MAG: TauD/TfdA family dioxygenase [Rhodospirillaceae bacterium]
MDLTIRPLSPGFGAEALGAALAGGGDNVAGTLRQAWLDAGGLLVVRDQDIAAPDHIAFASHFGPMFGAPGEPPLQDTVSIYIHPDHPEIYRVSNQVDANGKPRGRKGAGTYWHSDVSFRERPAGASILSAKQIPDTGGDTVFCDMTRAYAALAAPIQAMLAPLKAVHDFEVAARTQYAQPLVVETDMAGANRAVHPVVRTHAETGAKSLYVNPGFTSHIEGLAPDESKALLNFLARHCTQPEFLYRHRWQAHDLVIWDNRCLMHYAVMDYPDDQPRYMERTTGIGERPL